MTEISPELDYQKKSSSYPQYRMLKVLQQTGGQTVTISGGGGQTSIFEIPVQVMNLSISELYFTMTPGANGITTAYNWIFKDCASPIAHIELITRGGKVLCDVPFVANYTKIIPKAETHLENYLNYDLGTALNVGTFRYLRKSNSLASCTTTTEAAPFALRHDNSVAYCSYTEPQYLEPGITGNAAITPALTICMPLGHLKNCLLACNKDLYFGEVINMRVTWAAVNRIGFTGTSVTNPVTGAAVLIQNVAIANLALFLAVENDQAICNSLMAKVDSGFTMLMPYIFANKTNLGAGSAAISMKLNRGNGLRLLKVYQTVFNNTETLNLAYDCNNIDGGNISSYYTSLNNKKLQEFNPTVSATVCEDYLLNREAIAGSVIQGTNMYRYNWFHLDNFSGFDIKDSQAAFNKEAGLPLDLEQKWEMYSTAVNQLNFYTFAITQRVLSISKAGIDVL